MLLFISPELIHGISPLSQKSLIYVLGVPPENNEETSPIFFTSHSSGNSPMSVTTVFPLPSNPGSRFLPVSRSSIIPSRMACFLASSSPVESISASISDSTPAMAFCSFFEGTTIKVFFNELFEIAETFVPVI